MTARRAASRRSSTAPGRDGRQPSAALRTDDTAWWHVSASANPAPRVTAASRSDHVRTSRATPATSAAASARCARSPGCSGLEAYGGGRVAAGQGIGPGRGGGVRPDERGRSCPPGQVRETHDSLTVTPGGVATSRSRTPAAAKAGATPSGGSVKWDQPSACTTATRRLPSSLVASAAIALDKVR